MVDQPTAVKCGCIPERQDWQKEEEGLKKKSNKKEQENGSQQEKKGGIANEVTDRFYSKVNTCFKEVDFQYQNHKTCELLFSTGIPLLFFVVLRSDQNEL